MKQFNIAVIQIKDSTDHVVRVQELIDEKTTRTACLPGGDFPNAQEIALSLKNLVELGVDLSRIFSEETTQENGGPQHRSGCPGCGNREIEQLGFDLGGQVVMCEKCGWRSDDETQ